MKWLLLTLLIVTVGFSCKQQISNNNSTAESLTQKDTPLSSAETDEFALYRKEGSIFHVARVVKTSHEKFDLLLFQVDTSTPEAAVQTFVSAQHLTTKDLTSKKTELNKNYDWAPFNSYDVLFVQIQPEGFKSELALLDSRQNIERQLTETLERERLGEWLASDLGPGGGNMLYKIKDIEKSLEKILMVSRKNNIEKSIRVGKRVSVSKEDWFYEVIFPERFTGTFNTM